jgi:hypothetical protein
MEAARSRRIEALQREGIVPVRVHRLGRVALVADRFGNEPFELPVIRRPQFVDVARRRVDVRPEALGEGAVVREAPDLGDEVDELTVAVVLRDGIGAAAVDTARHLAVIVLVLGEPLRERFRILGVAEAEEDGGHQRAVADPGALVRTGAGLQRRAVAMDEHVGDARPDGVADARISRDVEGDAAEPFAPVGGDGCERLVPGAFLQRDLELDVTRVGEDKCMWVGVQRGVARFRFGITMPG